MKNKSALITIGLFALGGLALVGLSFAGRQAVSIDDDDIDQLIGDAYIAHDRHADSYNEHYIQFGYNPPVDIDPRTQDFIQGAGAVTSMVESPIDGSFYITDRNGLIRRYPSSGGSSGQVVLDISSKVDTQGGFGEPGLLSMAFDQNFASNGHVYVYYNVRPNANTQLVRFTLPDRVTFDPGSEVLMESIFQPARNHNGGGLGVSPIDGKLYLALGDGAGGSFNSQDTSNLLGSLVRFDVANNNFNPETVAIGLRNPWKMTFDSETGDLYIGDVGDGNEELNLLPNGATGYNFGYGAVGDGSCSNNCGPPGSGATYTNPIYSYSTYGGGSCGAIIGGAFYRGDRFEYIEGNYLHADYCRGLLYFIAEGENGRWSERERIYIGYETSLSSVTSDSNGNLYFTSIRGDIRRVEVNSDH